MQRPLLLILACNLVGALPLQLPAFNHQQPLLPISIFRPSQILNQHLERVPRSAELLFTASDDDQMIHVWLPLGKRIHARDYPILPLHPATVRIVNVLGASNQLSTRSRQQQVTCVIKTRPDAREKEAYAAMRKKSELRDSFSIAFQEIDMMADFENVVSAWYLGGKEVESYECF